MTTLLAFAFVLGVLVFVHELGHFLAAKRVGIRVLKFQLGFNPTVISFRRGDTEYGIGAIAEGSPAAGAGVRPGDRIETVNDHTINTWEQLYIAIGSRPNREVDLRVRRDGQPTTLKMTPTTTGQGRFEFGDIGVFPSVHPHLASVTPGDPGARGGLKDGDVIVAVDGKQMSFHSQMRELIASHPEKPMKITVDRGGVQETLTVTPDRHGTVGWLGVRPVDDTISVKPGAVQAVTMSVERN